MKRAPGQRHSDGVDLDLVHIDTAAFAHRLTPPTLDGDAGQ